MSIRGSAYFNNPAFAQAAANLSALFAPPSGSDAAGWATANEKNAAAKRLAEFYDYRNNPNFNQQTFDRMGVAAGAYTPNQSYYAQDANNATQRYGYDTQAATSRANNVADNKRALATNAADNARALQTNQLSELGKFYAPLNEGQVRPDVPSDIAAMYGVPHAVEAAQGRDKPLSETEFDAQQKQRLIDQGSLTDQDLLDAIVGDKTPVQAVGPDNRPMFMSPGAAVRTGAQPYAKPDDTKFDNYLAVGLDGQEKRFLGYVGPGNQIFDASTHEPVPNVLRKEGTGGGVSFETDGNGGIKLSTGNAAGLTTARVGDLQRQETEAGRAVNELTGLFETLRPDDLGAAGNLNEFLTNYGAQVIPSLARPDVAGTRAQLDATTLGLARAIVQDDRLSDSDREAAKGVMVSGGLGESLPGARAKLASLIALSAYRKKYANAVRNGDEPLPPLDGRMLGRLVDEKAISPAVAQLYSQNVLARGAQSPDGILPGVNMGQDIDAVRGALSTPEQAPAPARLRFDENGNPL
jgi:hypothetical protein